MPPPNDKPASLDDLLRLRFGELGHPVPPELAANDALKRIAARGVCRRFTSEPVPSATLDTLCAIALASPSKSDLQQRDIIIIEDAAIRSLIDTLLMAQDWIAKAPVFLVFCGNNRRQRQLHEWRGRPFANDHLDPFFNASVDAAIALATFVVAADAAGLGCCPVSIIRDHSTEVSRLLGLPDHVFPVSGLGLGWPALAPRVSLRLPLSATVHRDRYKDEGMRERVQAYDVRREALQPAARQTEVARFGETHPYGWSEDKARMYSKPQRADFGAYVRRIGFKLD